MAGELQQREEVARPVGQRRAGEAVHDGVRTLRDQLARELRPLGRVVLEVVGLVEHEPLQRELEELVLHVGEDVVVDDDPAAKLGARCGRRPDDADFGVGVREPNLSRPVLLHGGRAHDQPRPLRGGLDHRDDGLPRLPESHVVGQDGLAPREQERDAFDLVREQTLRDAPSAGEGFFADLRRRGQDPGELSGVLRVHVDSTPGAARCAAGAFVRRASGPRASVGPPRSDQATLPLLGRLAASRRSGRLSRCWGHYRQQVASSQAGRSAGSARGSGPLLDDLA